MSTKKTNRPFWGTILFERIGDVCYNGIWQNNDLNKPGRIHNEIIRKIEGERDTIAGNYVSSWIEGTNEQENTRLQIARINQIEFSFIWRSHSNRIRFNGVGMEIGVDKLIVVYWMGATVSLTI